MLNKCRLFLVYSFGTRNIPITTQTRVCFHAGYNHLNKVRFDKSGIPFKALHVKNTYLYSRRAGKGTRGLLD